MRIGLELLSESTLHQGHLIPLTGKGHLQNEEQWPEGLWTVRGLEPKGTAHSHGDGRLWGQSSHYPAYHKPNKVMSQAESWLCSLPAQWLCTSRSYLKWE